MSLGPAGERNGRLVVGVVVRRIACWLVEPARLRIALLSIDPQLVGIPDNDFISTIHYTPEGRQIKGKTAPGRLWGGGLEPFITFKSMIPAGNAEKSEKFMKSSRATLD